MEIDSTNQVRTISPLLSVIDFPTRSSANPPIRVQIWTSYTSTKIDMPDVPDEVSNAFAGRRRSNG